MRAHVANFGEMSFQKQAPSEFLKQIIGKPVVVKLNSGVDYRGESLVHGVCGIEVGSNKNVIYLSCMHACMLYVRML